jgi:hypothetical protein
VHVVTLAAVDGSQVVGIEHQPAVRQHPVDAEQPNDRSTVRLRVHALCGSTRGWGVALHAPPAVRVVALLFCVTLPPKQPTAIAVLVCDRASACVQVSGLDVQPALRQHPCVVERHFRSDVSARAAALHRCSACRAG